LVSQVILVNLDFRVSLGAAVRKVLRVMMDLLDSQAPRASQVLKVKLAHQADRASQELRVTVV